MLNLNDLFFFVRVVEHGGFAAAARALGTPKSTLSKRVAALEAQLQARLIQRTSRSFVMTDAGQAFFRHASAMLIEAEAAENAVKGRQAEPSGFVRLTASITTAQLLLAGLLPELAALYPRLQVVLHATDRFVDLVQEGFDIAVRDHSAPLADSELVQRRIGFTHFVLVASPAYLQRCGVPAQPGDLAGHDGLLITPSPASAVWNLHAAGEDRTAVSPRPRFFADEPMTLLQAAVSGLGIGNLPEDLCAPSLAAGTLVRVLPGWLGTGMATTLLISHRRGQLPSVRATVEFLAERVAALRAAPPNP